MTFHINGRGETKQCHAKIKCRFGGPTGKENHYKSREEAEVAAQKLLEKAHPEVNQGLRRGDKRLKSLEALEDHGMQVSQVSSIQKHTFKNSEPFTWSTVDVMEEKPTPALLEALRREAVSLF